MPVFDDRLKSLAVRIQDPVVDGATEAYITHVARPGPVVTLLGASGRGKSTLIADMTGIDPPPGGEPVAVYAEPWAATLHATLPSGYRPVRGSVELQRNTLVVEAPPIDRSDAEALAKHIANWSDLVLFAVQAGQAGSDLEIAFASDVLVNKQVVVVITKTDQLLEDDLDLVISEFVDSLRAVSVAPAAVLTAGLPRDADDSAALGFGRWWREAGAALAESAHQSSLKERQRSWFSTAGQVVDTAIAKAREQLSAVEQTVRVSGTAAAAQKTHESIERTLAVLPDRALEALRSVTLRCPDQVLALVREVTEDGTVQDANLPAAVEQKLTDAIGEFYERALARVRERLKPQTSALTKAVNQFAREVRAISASTDEMVQAYDRTDVSPSSFGAGWAKPELDMPTLSEADDGFLRSNKLQIWVLAAMAGGMVLSGALLPGAVSAGLALRQVYSTKQIDEANRRKLRSLVLERVRVVIGRWSHQMEQQVQAMWRSYANAVRDAIVPYRRLLDAEMEAHGEWRDPSLKDEYRRLHLRLDELATLRRDLDALAGSAPGGDT